MYTWGKKWVLVLLALLLVIVIALGAFLYGAATNYAEAISVCLVFSIFLMLVYLIPLEAFVSDLIGRIVYYLFSELGGILLAWLGEWRDVVSRFGGILRFALFILGSVYVVYGLLVVIVESVLPCQPFLVELMETPLDTQVLSKCPFTEPLTELISKDFTKVSSNASNFLSVLVNYIGLFLDNLYLGIAIAFASGFPRHLWGKLALALFSAAQGQDGNCWTRRQRIRVEKLRRFGDLFGKPERVPDWVRMVYDTKTEPGSGNETRFVQEADFYEWVCDLRKRFMK